MYKDIVDDKGIYNTPLYLFNYLHKHFCFETDPCDTGDKWLGLPYNFNEKDDGLVQEWNKNTFVNPPYNSFNENIWLKKSILEFDKYHKNIFILLPAKTESNWFGYAMQKATVVIFPQGRISFVKDGKTMNGNTMGSVIFGFIEHTLVIYDGHSFQNRDFIKENEKLGIPIIYGDKYLFFPSRDLLKEHYSTL